MNINLELYKVFYYVAKNESITRAANELAISQPAISKSIKTLVLAQKLWDNYLVLDISNSFKKKYSSSG